MINTEFGLVFTAKWIMLSERYILQADEGQTSHIRNLKKEPWLSLFLEHIVDLQNKVAYVHGQGVVQMCGSRDELHS